MLSRFVMVKAMAPHSSTLVWKIPWMEEPGRVQSMGLQRVGHDWATELNWLRWGNNGNRERRYFLGLQNHCRWWLQPWNWKILLGRKAITNLDSILKSRDITLPTKVCLVKAVVFPLVMYGCESWTIKKPECRRIGGFELWCWRRLLRVPWTARRSNQSILKEIRPEYSLEGLMAEA